MKQKLEKLEKFQMELKTSLNITGRAATSIKKDYGKADTTSSEKKDVDTETQDTSWSDYY